MSAIQTPNKKKKKILLTTSNQEPPNVKKVRVTWEFWNTNSGYDKHSILLKYDCMEIIFSEQPAASSSGSNSASTSDTIYFKSEHTEITEYYDLNSVCITNTPRKIPSKN